MKRAFSCTLHTIIRGSLFGGIDSITLFLMNLFHGNIFFFLFPFFNFVVFVFTRRSTGGGGHGPLVSLPLSYESGRILVSQAKQREN